MEQLESLGQAFCYLANEMQRIENCLVVLQVRNIFQLYADIEHTSRNNAFYEKYNLRYSMGELLRESHIPAPQ